MDRVVRNWELLLGVMRVQERLANQAAEPCVDSLLLIDPDRRVVQLQDMGWRNRTRVNDTYILVRIKDGKVWVETDWTEEGVANELVAAGVPKSDIVLAFQPPELRHLGDFAVA